MRDAHLLDRYFKAPDPAAAEEALEALVRDRAEPVILKVVRAKLAFRRDVSEADCEDVCSEAVVSLLVSLMSALDQSRESGGDPIGDFEAFVAVIASRACSDHIRRKYPVFHRLRNRLRYVLRTVPNLAIWQGRGGTWLCGWSRWKSRDAPAPLDEIAAGAALRPNQDPAEALDSLFKFAKGPVMFDVAVRMVAQRAGVVDEVPREVSSLPLADPAPLPDSGPDQRDWLKRLWSQILQLPPKQRTALLLNLRDEGGACATTVFLTTGVAGLADLAAALALPVDEFAALWRAMPLEDLRVAERMGITRQQVINLRKCARERLSRRMFPRNPRQAVINRAGEGHKE